MRFNSYDIKKRPDQTVYELNLIQDRLNGMRKTMRIYSEDMKQVIVIGNQPQNPETGKPYPFGIHTYKILGDRLEKL